MLHYNYGERNQNTSALRRTGASWSQIAPAPTPEEDSPHEDEIGEYLKLPQIANTGEWAGLKWWADNKKRFPNLSRMARQYLGCPASSAGLPGVIGVGGAPLLHRRHRLLGQAQECECINAREHRLHEGQPVGWAR